MGVIEARAEVKLSDTFSVTGFLRQQLAVHKGETNPNNIGASVGAKYPKQTDRNEINLSRSFFQTEWTYLPNDTFKLYSKVKLISDQTKDLDGDLKGYNAFPLGTPKYGTYLRADNDTELDAEMTEVYADVSLGNLWLRLGKQQIVWGDWEPMTWTTPTLYVLVSSINMEITGFLTSTEWCLAGRRQERTDWHPFTGPMKSSAG